MKINLPSCKFNVFLASLIVFLFTNSAVKAQTQVNIILSGFNQDVIADNVLNTDPNTVTTTSVDNPPGYAFFAQGYSTTATPYSNGLPDNGQITSSAGHTFQFANYTGNNDLRLPQNTSGTLIFDPSDRNSYASLFVLGTAGSGNSGVLYTVYFSDLSTFSGSFIFQDWYCPSCSQYAINGLDRVELSPFIGDDQNPNFVIYENNITLTGGNENKIVDSIGFSVPNNNGVTNIFAITGILTSSLPVTLENFTLTQDNGNALLNWKTAQELNSSLYIIQRANSNSPDAFITVGTVKATSSPLGSSYHFEDNPGYSGTFFYRLIEQDIDGKSQILGTKSITLGSNTTWSVQDLGTQWDLICPQPFRYRLVDIQGRVLSGANGSGNAIINKPQASGIYLLQVQTNGTFSAQKIIK